MLNKRHNMGGKHSPNKRSIQIRIHKDEKDSIEAAAKQAGVTMTEFVLFASQKLIHDGVDPKQLYAWIASRSYSGDISAEGRETFEKQVKERLMNPNKNESLERQAVTRIILEADPKTATDDETVTKARDYLKVIEGGPEMIERTKAEIKAENDQSIKSSLVDFINKKAS